MEIIECWLVTWTEDLDSQEILITWAVIQEKVSGLHEDIQSQTEASEATNLSFFASLIDFETVMI